MTDPTQTKAYWQQYITDLDEWQARRAVVVAAYTNAGETLAGLGELSGTEGPDNEIRRVAELTAEIGELLEKAGRDAEAPRTNWEANRDAAIE